MTSRLGISRRGVLAGLALVLARPRATAALAPTIDAGALGAFGDGRTDATAALNAAARAVADGGGTLYLPPGRYRITSPVLLRSGTTMTGPGATIFATDEWLAPSPGRDGTKLGRALVGNAGHAAASLTDRDITVRAINFQYIGIQDGEAHAVRLRQVRGVVVDDCTFSGGGNATAFLACRDTMVARCVSQGTLNCAYDHWEGTSDSMVQHCVATCARGYGVLFTGVGTEMGNHQHAARLNAIGNRIYSPSAAGIWVCALSQHSSVSAVVLRDNLVRGGPFKAAGIGATGAVSDLLIENNRVEDIKGQSALFLRPDNWNRPRDVRMLRNRIARCETDEPQIALIQALGDDIQVRGNRVTGGTFPALVWADGQRVVLSDNSGGSMTGPRKYRTERAVAPKIDDP